MDFSILTAEGVPAIQANLSFLDMRVWQWITHLGDAAVPLLLFVIACALQRYRLALTLGAAGCFTGILVGLLKQTIHEPRPYLVNADVNVLLPSAGFGMPSGHSATVFITFFVLCLYLNRQWLWPIFLSIVIVVGLSRAALGVHSLGQIVAGWSLATIVISVLLLAQHVSKPWSGRKRAITALLLCGSFCGAFLYYFHVHITRLAAEFSPPVSWIKAHELITSGNTVQAQQADQVSTVNIAPLNLFNTEFQLLIPMLAGIAIAFALRQGQHALPCRDDTNTPLPASLAIAIATGVCFIINVLSVYGALGTSWLGYFLLLLLAPVLAYAIPQTLAARR